MPDSLKQKTISGMMWTSFGKFGSMIIAFIANLILARLLSPDDFGCVGMLAIFIAISQTFIEGGFGSALIQKKNPEHIEYTTIFYWNLLVSFFFVVGIYFLAPSIASFYKIPLLENVLRIQSLILLINAFSVIPANILIKQLKFKVLNIRNIVAAFCGMIVAVIMAWNGFGVWSLVYNNLVTSTVSVLLLWTMTSWRPTMEFSWGAIKRLFRFGGLILCSNLVETLYTNIQGLIIGRVFSAKDLGYYAQAKKLEEVPNTGFSSVVNSVTFPIYSVLQDDKTKMRFGVHKSLVSITYLNIPLMVILILVAKPLFTLLFSIKWLPSVPYFQILCVFGMLWCVNTINTNLVKALGKGNIYFFIQVLKRVIGVILIFWSVQYGMYEMLWAYTFTGWVCFFINAYFAGKLIQYGVMAQIKAVGPVLLLSLGIGIITYAIFKYLIVNNSFLMVLVPVCVYISLYIFFSYLFKIEGFVVFKEILFDKFIRYFRNKND